MSTKERWSRFSRDDGRLGGHGEDEMTTKRGIYYHLSELLALASARHSPSVRVALDDSFLRQLLGTTVGATVIRYTWYTTWQVVILGDHTSSYEQSHCCRLK